MDGKIRKPDGTEPYIWLRYATEITTNGRRQTIEMGIPMPVGASDEEREQLLQEAEAGMGQLVRHVEQRIHPMIQQMQGRSLSTGSQPAQAAPKPAGAPSAQNTPATPPSRPAASPPSIPAAASTVKPVSTPPAQPTPAPPAPKPVVRPAAIAAPQTSAQAPQTAVPSAPEVVRETPPDVAEAASPAPPKTGGVGINMPRSSLPVSDGSGNLSVPAFISYIREQWDLNPKQAMAMLNVKTLSGINLREAIEQLRRLVAQKTVSAPAQPEEKRVEEVKNTAPAPRPPVNTPASRPTPPSAPQIGAQAGADRGRGEEPRSGTPDLPLPIHSAPPPGALDSLPGVRRGVLTAGISSSPSSNAAGKGEKPDREQNNGQRLREARPVVFDEEVGPEESDLDDLADLDEPYELSDQERNLARDVLTRLRSRGGPTPSSPARLQVLNNVMDGQVSNTQLLDLVRNVWSVTTLKKLKIDQVEELISWAKEDDFINEVEAVLALLEEE